MRSFRLLAVMLGHIAFAGLSYGTWAMGQNFAPELMGSQVVIYPLVMGILGCWVWYGFWSAGALRTAQRGGDS